jgi:hypothetical protein
VQLFNAIGKLCTAAGGFSTQKLSEISKGPPKTWRCLAQAELLFRDLKRTVRLQESMPVHIKFDADLD